jgi:ABC-type uncharacterized transport system auxiliary subunit
MVWRQRGASGAILVTAAVAGCWTPEIPTDHFYRLSFEPALTPSNTTVLNGGILVDRSVADGLIGDRAIIYVSADAPTALQAFSYHFWSAPPANMIQDLLVRCLRAGAVTDEVVTPEQRVETRYTLFSELQRMEMHTGPAPSVVLSLDMALRDDKQKQLLMSQTYQAEGIPADSSIGAAAEAMSGAFSTICGQLITRLADRGA